MEITLRYTLSTGEVVDWTSSDFASMEAARKTCLGILNTPNSTAALHGPSGTRVISSAHIVAIEITPVGKP